MTTNTTTTLLATLLLLSSKAARGLDISVDDVSCTDGYEVTGATLSIDCEGSSQCSFGSTVDLSGSLTFAGLADNENIQDNTVYVIGTMHAPVTGTELFTFVDFEPVQVCDYLESEEAACPADGTYTFGLEGYGLPDSSQFADYEFWATGWNPTAKLVLEDGSQNVVGECIVYLTTFDTVNSASNNPIRRMANGKSALIAAVLMTLGALMLCCTCCYCMRKRTSKTVEESGETEFVRMNDKPAVDRDAANTGATVKDSSAKGGPVWAAV